MKSQSDMRRRQNNWLQKSDRKSVRTAMWSLLGAYAFVLLYLTVLKRRPVEGNHLQLRLFWSYQRNLRLWIQIIGNIAVFIPIGFLSEILMKNHWRVLLFGGLYSAIIELLQFFFKLGLCELDDLVHNLLGTLIGLLLAVFIQRKMNKAGSA